MPAPIASPLPSPYHTLPLGGSSGFGRGHPEFASLLGARVGAAILRCAGVPVSATLVNCLGDNPQRLELAGPHSGFDLAVPEDAFLLAPRDGHVVTGALGAYVQFRGDDGSALNLSHVQVPVELTALTASPNPGGGERRQVRQGEVIAKMGRVWGTPHFHIAGNEKGLRALDPALDRAFENLSTQARSELAPYVGDTMV